MVHLAFESTLCTPATVVWSAVSDMRGVNHELSPWFAMTYPRGGAALRADAPVAADGFRSWLLLGGLVPVDRHSFGFEHIGDDGFVEASHSWMNRSWRHVRTVRPLVEQDRCVLRDEVTVEPRFALLDPVSSAGVGAVFAHRHRRLRRSFGTPDAAAAAESRS